MWDYLKILYNKYRELILYGIIGALCASIDFGVYSLLSLWIPYLVANIISVHCGIFCSFYLNRNYNFKVKDNTGKRFISFYLVGLAGLGLSEVLLLVFADKMGWHYLAAKLLTVIVVALFQFVLNKFVTFKTSNHE